MQNNHVKELRPRFVIVLHWLFNIEVSALLSIQHRKATEVILSNLTHDCCVFKPNISFVLLLANQECLLCLPIHLYEDNFYQNQSRTKGIISKDSSFKIKTPADTFNDYYKRIGRTGRGFKGKALQ